MKKIFFIVAAAAMLGVGAYELFCGRLSNDPADITAEGHPAPPLTIGSGPQTKTSADTGPLPALDAHGFNGIREISRPELVKQMSTVRSLSPEENANLDRGCPGFVCVYQGLGLKRWPELARDTAA